MDGVREAPQQNYGEVAERTQVARLIHVSDDDEVIQAGRRVLRSQPRLVLDVETPDITFPASSSVEAVPKTLAFAA